MVCTRGSTVNPISARNFHTVLLPCISLGMQATRTQQVAPTTRNQNLQSGCASYDYKIVIISAHAQVLQNGRQIKGNKYFVSLQLTYQQMNGIV